MAAALMKLSKVYCGVFTRMYCFAIHVVFVRCRSLPPMRWHSCPPAGDARAPPAIDYLHGREIRSSSFKNKQKSACFFNKIPAIEIYSKREPQAVHNCTSVISDAAAAVVPTIIIIQPRLPENVKKCNQLAYSFLSRKFVPHPPDAPFVHVFFL